MDEWDEADLQKWGVTDCLCKMRGYVREKVLKNLVPQIIAVHYIVLYASILLTNL